MGPVLWGDGDDMVLIKSSDFGELTRYEFINYIHQSAIEQHSRFIF